MPTPGYSGKSLGGKLGLTAGMRIAALTAPDELASWVAPLPEGAKILGGTAKSVACMLWFVRDRHVLERHLPRVLGRLAEGGMLWICWPKKASGVPTDLTENVLRDVVLPTNWVDVKVCAVSEVWSGLKFVRRRNHSSTPSISSSRTLRHRPPP